MRCISISTVAALGCISPAAAETAFAWCLRRDDQGLAYVPLAAVADVCRRTEDDLAACHEVIEL